MPPTPYAIVFDQVDIAYGGATVLRDFSLRVATGEKVVLTGRSGLGKSSLLLALLGFVEPAAGTISVLGQQVDNRHIKRIRKKTAYLPQSVEINIYANRQLVDWPFNFGTNQASQPTSTRLHDLLGKLGLPADILDKQTHEISGGQKQRLLLASVLLLDKPIMLLDEPSSALDKESTQRLVDLIRERPELTVLSVSHDENWIQSMDRSIPLSA